MAMPAERPLPQQDRARLTRGRLLDASIEAIVERGVAGASTSEIVRRAGVSQGALFKHFPTKAALLAAAAEHLFAGLVDDFRRAFRGAARSASAGDARVVAAIEELGRVFREPRLQAAFELYLAARTQPDLRAALAPALVAHRANLGREAAALFPEAAARHPRFAAVVDAVVDAMQGAAIGSVVQADEPARRREEAALARWVCREFAEHGSDGVEAWPR